jgi:acyl-CoA dehydrogenase
MANYFFKPGEFPEILKQDGQTNDDFLFNQGPAKGLGKIKFHDYRLIYNSVNLPNVKIFRKQIRLLKLLLIFAKPGKTQRKDFDFLLIVGELFTLVVYGQLILENAAILSIEDELVDQIFDFMIRDFSK